MSTAVANHLSPDIGIDDLMDQYLRKNFHILTTMPTHNSYLMGD